MKIAKRKISKTTYAKIAQWALASLGKEFVTLVKQTQGQYFFSFFFQKGVILFRVKHIEVNQLCFTLQNYKAMYSPRLTYRQLNEDKHIRDSFAREEGIDNKDILNVCYYIKRDQLRSYDMSFSRHNMAKSIVTLKNNKYVQYLTKTSQKDN